MSIDAIRACVLADVNAVNTLIVDSIQSDVGLVDSLSHHIVNSGGKRLRPLLVLLASRACGYQGDDHIKLAAMVEFFHTATLLHDDVVDESTLRRGKKTANEIWGSKASILVGDFMFTQSVKLLVSLKNQAIFTLMADTSHDITLGEVKQLNNRHKTDLSIEDYFDVIRSKTALLFAACAAMGAQISQQDDKTIQALYQYGLKLGNAFQLIDDALDYCSDADTIGKNIGDDLADGKATLPLIHALKHGTEAQQHLIKNSLINGDRTQLPAILEAIVATHAIEYTKQVANLEIDDALSAIHMLAPSAYKTSLIQLAHYAVDRDY